MRFAAISAPCLHHLHPLLPTRREEERLRCKRSRARIEEERLRGKRSRGGLRVGNLGLATEGWGLEISAGA